MKEITAEERHARFVQLVMVGAITTFGTMVDEAVGMVARAQEIPSDWIPSTMPLYALSMQFILSYANIARGHEGCLPFWAEEKYQKLIPVQG